LPASAWSRAILGRYVGSDALDRSTINAKQADRRGEEVPAPSCDGDFSALGNQGLRRGETDGARSAGDKEALTSIFMIVPFTRPADSSMGRARASSRRH
jgi:hypothetical protein